MRMSITSSTVYVIFFPRDILDEERNRQVEEMKRDNRRIQDINWSKFVFKKCIGTFITSSFYLSLIL